MPNTMSNRNPKTFLLLQRARRAFRLHTLVYIDIPILSLDETSPRARSPSKDYSRHKRFMNTLLLVVTAGQARSRIRMSGNDRKDILNTK